MTDNSLVPYRPDLFALADAFVRSGYFKDVKEAAQATVKIQYGQELGIGPVAAMRGIFINSQGRIELSAGLIGALVKRAGLDWQPVRMDDTACILRFVNRDGKPLDPPVSFAIEDARKAGLSGKDTYQKYPSDLLFARALTRMARRFCPEVFMGAVYVVGETGPADEAAPIELETAVPAESAAAVPHEDAGVPQPTPASEGLYAGEDANGDTVVKYDAATPPAAETQPTSAQGELHVTSDVGADWKLLIAELNKQLDGYYGLKTNPKAVNWQHVRNTLALHEYPLDIGPRNLNGAIDVLRDHAISAMRDARKAATQ